MKFALLMFAIGSLAFVNHAVSAADEKKPAGGTLYHVVHFKFKADATKEQIAEIEKAFVALPNTVEGITSFTWGTNVSPEKLDKGFTHCFLLSFGSEKDRDAYIVHADHEKFVALLKPLLEDAFVIDFWGK